MKRLLLVSLAICVAACAGSDSPLNNGARSTNNDTTNSTTGMCEDLDGDGFDGRSGSCPNGTDCDDASAQVHPAATEQCGDRRDNDCDGQVDEDCGQMSMECADADGDRYGTGPGCLGVDCDDSDPAINPGATEICGNSIDEDCNGGDQVCPSNCIDQDMDGYGAAGSTDCVDSNGMVLTEVDCDDTNAAVNASANEVCDGVDNDCDGEVDECAGAGQACVGDRCMGGAGAECEDHDDCNGQLLKCDRNQDPKVCRVAEGGMCDSIDDCIEGLACEAGMCTGDFCAVTQCSGTYGVCDRDQGACVECPHWEADPTVRDAPCDPDASGEECLPGGWCAFSELIDTDPLDYDISTDAELWWINYSLAWCWINVRPGRQKDICSAYWVDGAITRITKDAARAAYLDGHLDNALNPMQNDALKDVWGVGLFDREEIDWEEDLVPGTVNEVCLWYHPGGALTGETLVLDRCDNFTP